MKERWRLVADPPLPGAVNMAIDHAMLGAAEKGLTPPTLRLYGWSRPTLSIGLKQDAGAGLDGKFIRRAGVEVVRRPTGGRALLHHDEVTYAAVIPCSSRLYGPLRGIYTAVARALREALRGVGVDTDQCGADERFAYRNPCCFASKTPYEISIGGRKIAAGAQRRLKNAALQHGSIVLSHDAGLYVSCLRWVSAAEREKARAMLGGIGAAGKNVKGADLRLAIAGAFGRMYDIEFEQGGLTDHENDIAGRDVEKFRWRGDETLCDGGGAGGRDDGIRMRLDGAGL